MDWWYNEQLRQYRLQFVRAFSNFSVKFGAGTASETIQQVPCRYGEQSRIAASIVKGNSENKIPTCPFIACYVTGISMSPERRQDPSLVETIQVNERRYDAQQQSYQNTLGNMYSIDRYMPVPYTLTFEVTIWTSNIDTKEQLLEQILSLYNPSIDFQTSNNALDWTMLSVIEMTDSMSWSSISIPVGTDYPIDITSLQFKVPIWINPPAKIKRQAIIQEIVANISTGVLDEETMTWSDSEFLERVIVTPGDYDIAIDYVASNQYALSLNYAGYNIDSSKLPTVTFSSPIATLIPGAILRFNGIDLPIASNDLASFVNNARILLSGTNFSCDLYNTNKVKWTNYAGTDNVFSNTAGNACTQMGLQATDYPGGTIAWWRLLESYGTVKDYATFSQAASEIRELSDDVNLEWLDSDLRGWIQFHPTDQNRLLWFVNPATLPNATLAAITAIIDPEKTGPGAGLGNPEAGQRYLLLSTPSNTSVAWGTLSAHENDIIEFDGVQWNVSFDSRALVNTTQYVVNSFNGKLLKWHDGSWQNYIPNTVTPGLWRVSL